MDGREEKIDGWKRRGRMDKREEEGKMSYLQYFQ